MYIVGGSVRGKPVNSSVFYGHCWFESSHSHKLLIKMKVIFLDIDGVLNPTYYMNALHWMHEHSGGKIKMMDQYGQLFFDQNVQALNRVVELSGVKIVLSSTWRMAGLKQMKQMWIDRGLPGDLIDVTPTETTVVKRGMAEFYDLVSRGMEVECWLQDHPDVEGYVIIDDCRDFLEHQKERFVQTDPMIGFTEEDADRTIKILTSL